MKHLTDTIFDLRADRIKKESRITELEGKISAAVAVIETFEKRSSKNPAPAYLQAIKSTLL